MTDRARKPGDDAEIVVVNSKCYQEDATRRCVVDKPPEPVVTAVADEVMYHASPDGRPPQAPTRRTGKGVLALSVLVPLAGLVVLYVVGGWAALLVGVAMLLVLMGIAFPAWRAGQMRDVEENELKQEVRRDLAEERPVSRA